MKNNRKKQKSFLGQATRPRFGAGLAALGLAVMVGGLYVQAQASNSSTSCLDEKKASSYITKFTRGTGTISTKSGMPLCHSTNLVLESFSMPDTWDGKGFNKTAIPQTMFGSTDVTLPGAQANVSKTLNVSTPANCKNTQLDFYFPPAYEDITTLTGDDARYIGGMIFGKTTSNCSTPSPTPTPTPPASPTPTPVVSLACTKLTANVTSGQAPVTVNFTGTGTAEGQTISQYVFDFGDNEAISTSSNTATHVYATAGSYNAKLSVKGSQNVGGVTSPACNVPITVTAVPTPTPTPGATPTPTNTPSVAGVTTHVLPQTGVAGPVMTLIGALFITVGMVHVWLTSRNKLIVVPKKR